MGSNLAVAFQGGDLGVIMVNSRKKQRVEALRKWVWIRFVGVYSLVRFQLAAKRGLRTALAGVRWGGNCLDIL